MQVREAETKQAEGERLRLERNLKHLATLERQIQNRKDNLKKEDVKMNEAEFLFNKRLIRHARQTLERSHCS